MSYWQICIPTLLFIQDCPWGKSQGPMGHGTPDGDVAAPGEQSQQNEDSLVPRQSPSGLNKGSNQWLGGPGQSSDPLGQGDWLRASGKQAEIQKGQLFPAMN